MLFLEYKAFRNRETVQCVNTIDGPLHINIGFAIKIIHAQSLQCIRESR